MQSQATTELSHSNFSEYFGLDELMRATEERLKKFSSYIFVRTKNNAWAWTIDISTKSEIFNEKDNSVTTLYDIHFFALPLLPNNIPASRLLWKLLSVSRWSTKVVFALNSLIQHVFEHCHSSDIYYPAFEMAKFPLMKPVPSPDLSSSTLMSMSAGCDKSLVVLPAVLPPEISQPTPSVARRSRGGNAAQPGRTPLALPGDASEPTPRLLSRVCADLKRARGKSRSDELYDHVKKDPLQFINPDLDLDGLENPESLGEAIRILCPQIEELGLPSEYAPPTKRSAAEHLSKEEFGKLQNKEHARKTRRRKKMFSSFLSYTKEALEAILKVPASTDAPSPTTPTPTPSVVNETTVQHSEVSVIREAVVYERDVSRKQMRIETKVLDPLKDTHVCIDHEIAQRSGFSVSNLKMFRKFVTMKCSKQPKHETWRSVCVPEMFYSATRPSSRGKSYSYVVCRGEDEFMNYLEKQHAAIFAVLRTKSYAIEADMLMEKSYAVGMTCHFCYNYRVSTAHASSLSGSSDIRERGSGTSLIIQFVCEVNFASDGRILSMTEEYDAEGYMHQVRREDARNRISCQSQPTLPNQISSSRLRMNADMRILLVSRYLKLRFSQSPCDEDWLSVCTPDMVDILPPIMHRKMSSLARTGDMYVLEGLHALIDDTELRHKHGNMVMPGTAWELGLKIIAESVDHNWEANTMSFSYEVTVYRLVDSIHNGSVVGCTHKAKMGSYITTSCAVTFDPSDQRLRQFRQVFDALSVLSWLRGVSRNIAITEHPPPPLTSSNRQLVEVSAQDSSYQTRPTFLPRTLGSTLQDIASLRLATMHRFVSMRISSMPRSENWSSVCNPNVIHVLNLPTNIWKDCPTLKTFYSLQGINQLILNTEERTAAIAAIVPKNSGELWTWTVDITIRKENVQMSNKEGSHMAMTYDTKVYAVQVLGYNTLAPRSSWRLLLDGKRHIAVFFANDGLIDSVHEFADEFRLWPESGSEVQCVIPREVQWVPPSRQALPYSESQLSSPVAVPPRHVWAPMQTFAVSAAGIPSQSQTSFGRHQSQSSLTRPGDPMTWMTSARSSSWDPPPPVPQYPSQQYAVEDGPLYPTRRPITQQYDVSDNMNSDYLNPMEPL